MICTYISCAIFSRWILSDVRFCHRVEDGCTSLVVLLDDDDPFAVVDCLERLFKPDAKSGVFFAEGGAALVAADAEFRAVAEKVSSLDAEEDWKSSVVSVDCESLALRASFEIVAPNS